MQLKPQYKFYATLLDSFQYYLESESDNAFQEFIDKVNRVPFVSDAASKGSALNGLTDAILNRTVGLSNLVPDKKGNITWIHEGTTFAFKPDIVQKLMDYIQGSSQQILTKATLETSMGFVELYGYVDYIKVNQAIDLKTTGNYTFPKFLRKWQKHVYPFCLNANGIYVDEFAYLITDFGSIYLEVFPYKVEQTICELSAVCNRLIDFLESNRHLITDKKVFSLL